MFSFITHHKSSIIGIIGAILPYLLARGYIGMEEMQVITWILAVFGVSINIALPRK
jgi:uncharacterized membrane protein YeaQ/YmgE (transglycosylase-associated protein family)